MANQNPNPWEMDLRDLQRLVFSPASQQPQGVPEGAFAEFQQQCSDFKNTAENRDVLLKYIINPAIATANDFRQAHALATYQQTYQQPQVVDPWKMSMSELGKTAGIEHKESTSSYDMFSGVKTENSNRFTSPEVQLPAQPDQSNTAAQLLESTMTSSEREVRAIQFAKENMPYISGGR